MRRVRVALPPILLAGMLALCGAALGQIYSTALLAVLVAGAAAGAALIGLATRALPAWTAGPISATGLLGYVAFTVWYSARQAGVGGGFGGVAIDAVGNGVPRLVTAMLPIEPQPDTIVVPVIVTWLAGLASTELAIRSQRFGLALLPPTAAFAGALYLVGPHGSGTVWPSLGFAALGALILAVTRNPRPGVTDPGGTLDPGVRRALRLRAALSAATGVTVIVILAAIAAVPVFRGVGTAPTDPRAQVTPPRLDALDENPLSRISGWSVTPEQHLLDATLSHAGRLRLAVLSEYDGITWRVGGVYRPAGHVLPPPPPPPAPTPPAEGEAPRFEPGVTDQIEQRISVAELGGKLLPAVGTPRRVDGVRVALDPTTGTLVLPEGLRPGLVYTVVSQRTTTDVNVLAAADVPAGQAVAPFLAFSPSVPGSLQQVAQQLAAENAAPYQRAVAIEQFLADHYTLDPRAPSGHAYRNLEYFLFGPARGGGRKGTSEQFAATFALLARMVGLPSRVVVGFTVREGENHLLARDAYAWPEVLYAGIGWVPFDPLPRPDQPRQPLEPEFEPKPEPSTPPPSEVPPPTVDPGTAGPTGLPSTATRVAGGTAVLPVVGASVGGLALLAAIGMVLAIIAGRRALRRRRLEQGTDAERVTGAWLELHDALRLAGDPPARSLSAAEIARHAREAAAPAGHRRVRLPAPPIDELTAQVNAVTFAESRDVDAARAAAQATAFIEELRARRPWWRRLTWAVHPGPLRWQRTREGSRAARRPRP